jgi:hypothetical protein
MTSLGANFGSGFGFYKGQLSSLGPNQQALNMPNQLNVAMGSTHLQYNVSKEKKIRFFFIVPAR